MMKAQLFLTIIPSALYLLASSTPAAASILTAGPLGDLPPTPTFTHPTPSCSADIPCPPMICPQGQCYVYTPQTGFPGPCPTQNVCACGPNPYIATPVVNPTPKPVEACSEKEVQSLGCTGAQTAVPTSFGAACRQCVCADK